MTTTGREEVRQQLVIASMAAALGRWDVEETANTIMDWHIREMEKYLEEIEEADGADYGKFSDPRIRNKIASIRERIRGEG